MRAAAAEILLEMAKHEPAGMQALGEYKSAFDRELATLASDADPEVCDIVTELIPQLGFLEPSSFAGRGFQDQIFYAQLELAV
jgi:hypothetical protein